MEMIPYIESDLDRFVRAVLLDLDAAGALADYLDERDPPTAPYLSGKPSLSRGELLRRRWKKWKKERARSVNGESNLAGVRYRLYKSYRVAYPNRPASEALRDVDALLTDEIETIDAEFVRYIRRKFGVKWATYRNFF